MIIVGQQRLVIFRWCRYA